MTNRNVQVANFIRVLSSEPILWDITHPNYYNREARRGKWGEIAQRCGMTDQKARKRFKWIRDEYRNQTKKLEMGLQLSDKRLRWMESLSFLRNLKSRYRRQPAHNIYAQYNHDSNDDGGSDDHDDAGMYDLSDLPAVPIISLDESQMGLPGLFSMEEQDQDQSLYASHAQHQQPEAPAEPPKNQVTINLTANPSKVVTLGDFIDELISQEPPEKRERFQVEVLESFVKIKRQFVEERSRSHASFARNQMQ